MKASKPHILMCRPDYYGVEYEINAWMDRRRPVDRALAEEQWTRLRDIFVDLGAIISYVEPVEGFPDMVFTANAAMIFHRRAIMSRFLPVQRRGEEEHYAKWFLANGFTVEHLPDGNYFEGAGDALFCGDTLIAGYQIRSHAISQQRVGNAVGCRVIPVELIDPHYYHLDTCFCPLNGNGAIYYPAAFDDYGQQVIREFVGELIELEPEEAASFAANAVVIGNNIVTNTGCPRLQQQLRSRGFATFEAPLGEFVKAGGSAKCLTLRLDGEEAAGWKTSKR